jgi:hypothetical protein
MMERGKYLDVVTVRVPTETRVEVKRRADLAGVSAQEFLRRIIDAALSSEEPLRPLMEREILRLEARVKELEDRLSNATKALQLSKGRDRGDEILARVREAMESLGR